MALFKCISCIFVCGLICSVNGKGDSIELELKNDMELGKVFMYELATLPGGRKTRAQAGDRRLDIYCYAGVAKKDLWRMWTSYNLRIFISTEYYVVYLAQNASEVYHQHREATTSWLMRFMPWRTDNIPLAVFNRTCVGVSTMDPYAVSLQQKAVDPWIVGCLLVGLILFFSAKTLSRNLMFYYGTGIGVGLLASLLILVLILSRFMPQRYGAYAVLVGGWSVVLWFVQYVWTNIQNILEQYIEYVAGYFIATALISFGILYYKGPVTDPKLINLIKWTLQGIALVLVYNGTQLPEVSATIIVILLVLQAIPRPSVFSYNRSFWWRLAPRFAPKPRLLTEEEYIKQGREETRKALDSLRDYCRSPDCNAWKTMSKLHTPQRFAQFIDGGLHVSENELSAYDLDPVSLDYDESYESEMDFQLNSP